MRSSRIDEVEARDNIEEDRCLDQSEKSLMGSSLETIGDKPYEKVTSQKSTANGLKKPERRGEEWGRGTKFFHM